MGLEDQVGTLDFGSIKKAGAGFRSLAVTSDDVGPAVGVALAASETRGLRLARGILASAPDADTAVADAQRLIGWAAKGDSEQRALIARTMRLERADVFLIDRIGTLPRTQARPFMADFFAADGRQPLRHRPQVAAGDLLRRTVRALRDAGQALVDLAVWAAGQVVAVARDVVRALIEAGTRVVDLVTSLAGRAFSVIRAVVDGLFALGRTLAGLVADLAGIAVDLLAEVLRGAIALGRTVAELVGGIIRRTYRFIRRVVDAALRAGIRVAQLLAEVAGRGYFALRRIVDAVLRAAGPLGQVLDWALTQFERGAAEVFRRVLTAIRFAGGKLRDALDWVVDKGEAALQAVMEAWERIGEDLRALYRWAKDQGEAIWERIGAITQRLRNSVSYVLTYLERDFLPGVRRFITGLLRAGAEVAGLIARLARRSAQLVGEVVGALLDFGVALGDIVITALTEPDELGDAVVRAVREAGRTLDDVWAAVASAGEDAWAELVATLHRLEEPVKDILDGAAEVVGGAIGTVIGVLFELLATYRPLTADEIAAGRLVFGGSLDWDEIHISQESLDNDIIFGVQEFFNGSPDSRAFVTMKVINIDVDEPLTTATLIHELTHVWQATFEGPLYLAAAVHAQVTSDDAYDYGYDDATNGDGAEQVIEDADGDLSGFNPEQQGQIAMHYWVRRFEEGRDRDEWEHWERFADTFQAAA
jgi:hypothetical protein